MGGDSDNYHDFCMVCFSMTNILYFCDVLLTTGVYTGKLCINKEAGLTHTWWWLFKDVARFRITEASEEGY